VARGQVAKGETAFNGILFRASTCLLLVLVVAPRALCWVHAGATAPTQHALSCPGWSRGQGDQSRGGVRRLVRRVGTSCHAACLRGRLVPCPAASLQRHQGGRLLLNPPPSLPHVAVSFSFCTLRSPCNRVHGMCICLPCSCLYENGRGSMAGE
jgi:hypothetical protein